MPESETPTISLAVMVRDDAVRLDRCIRSVKDHVDQVVVLDTGSKDDSVQVAKSHGATVHEIEWPNSFGVALNVLLSHIETTWVVRLDADEWFDEAMAKELRSMIADETACGFRLIRRDLNAAGSYSEISLNRLWRSHELIRYAGTIHESIPIDAYANAFPGLHWMNSDVFFWHDGYASDMSEKTARNVQLLRKELELNPEKIETEAMLATSLKAANDPEAATRLDSLADKLLAEEMEKPGPQVALALVMYLAAIPVSKVRTPRTKALIDLAVEWYADNPAILYYAAILEKERGDLEGALNLLIKSETLATSGEYDRSMSIPQEFVGEKLWNALGFVAAQLGRQDVLHRCNRRMLMLRTHRR